MLKPRFIVQAIGPEGGSRTKSGIHTVRAFLIHSETLTSLTVKAFLKEGVPYIEISAFKSGKDRMLIEGPMEELF